MLSGRVMRLMTIARDASQGRDGVCAAWLAKVRKWLKNPSNC